jgi:hypothetical protein
MLMSGRLASGGLMRPAPTPSYDGGREEAAMADPVGDIIGDYRAFAAQQHDRLLARGIDIRPYPLSHLAVRVPEWDQYAHVRNLLERHAVANRENVWNGRPISLIVPAEPLEVLDGKLVPLIELIPPCTSASTRWGWSTSASWSVTLSTRSSEPTSPSSQDSNSRARTAHPTPSTSCSRTSPT